MLGWRPGDPPLDSYRLCALMREGGLPLGDAMRHAQRVVAGEDVTINLPFAEVHTASAAVRRLGARVGGLEAS